MDLSIIIVNWNTRELLASCLRSIAACSGTLAVQTIVVDNNSADGSRELVTRSFPEVLLLNSGGNLGFARANNLALSRAAAPLILFLNPDTEIRGDALRAMAGAMSAHPEVGALGCKTCDAAGRTQPLGLQWFPSPLTELIKFLLVSERTPARLTRFLPFRNPECSGYVEKLFGACLVVRRTVLDQVGSFDERFFMYCEDVDLCYRIGRAGWRLYYLSTAEILHVGAGASSAAPGTFAILMSCESFSKFMRKHHGRGGSAAYRVICLLGSQARLLMLLGLRLLAWLRPARPRVVPDPAVRKYLTIARWSLGLQRPRIAA